MHVHRRDWAAAMRIADQYDRDGKQEVMLAQANDVVENGYSTVRLLVSNPMPEGERDSFSQN